MACCLWGKQKLRLSMQQSRTLVKVLAESWQKNSKRGTMLVLDGFAVITGYHRCALAAACSPQAFARWPASRFFMRQQMTFAGNGYFKQHGLYSIPEGAPNSSISEGDQEGRPGFLHPWAA